MDSIMSCFRTNILFKQFLAELVGTFILVTLVDSSVATGFFAGNINHLAVAIAAGTGLYIAVLFGATVKAGHVNPVVTLGLFSVGKCSLIQLVVYIIGQYIGGFLATLFVYFNNIENINAYLAADNSTKLASAAGIFMSFPNKTVGPVTIIIDQILCVGILMFAIMALLDKGNDHNKKELIPLGLLFVLAAVIIAFGYNSGAAINPARDIPARLLTYIIGFGSEVFSGNYWLTGSLVGPHLGAIIGALIYYLFHENSNPAKGMNDGYALSSIQGD